VQAMGVPVIYFGVETAGLLGAMAETGADVIGLDWRQPLDQGWRAVGHGHVAPRFVAEPDNRDFFYMVRKGQSL